MSIIKINPPIPEILSSWKYHEWLNTLGLTGGSLTFSSTNQPAYLEIEGDISQEKFNELLASYEQATPKLQVVQKVVDQKGTESYKEVRELPTELEKSVDESFKSYTL